MDHSTGSFSGENGLLYVVQNSYSEKPVKCGSLIYKNKKDIRKQRRKERLRGRQGRGKFNTGEKEGRWT